MASTDSVSAASSSSAAALSAPASGHRPNVKKRKEPQTPKEQLRPSQKELTNALNKVLGEDGKLMKETLLNGRIFGTKEDSSVVAMVMASMPKKYPWKPTVPPCLAGWIQT